MNQFEEKFQNFQNSMGVGEEDIDAFVFIATNQLEKDELLNEISNMSVDEIRRLMIPYFRERINGLSSME